MSVQQLLRFVWSSINPILRGFIFLKYDISARSAGFIFLFQYLCSLRLTTVLPFLVIASTPTFERWQTRGWGVLVGKLWRFWRLAIRDLFGLSWVYCAPTLFCGRQTPQDSCHVGVILCIFCPHAVVSIPVFVSKAASLKSTESPLVFGLTSAIENVRAIIFCVCLENRATITPCLASQRRTLHHDPGAPSASRLFCVQPRSSLLRPLRSSRFSPKSAQMHVRPCLAQSIRSKLIIAYDVILLGRTLMSCRRVRAGRLGLMLWGSCRSAATSCSPSCAIGKIFQRIRVPCFG